jgi:hypothetical protein
MTEVEKRILHERNGVMIDEVRRNGAYRFSKGNKQLSIVIFLDNAKAFGNISSVEGRQRIPGSTTAVYSEARQELQRIANETAHEIGYYFVTDSPVLLAWAHTHGKEVFGWDNIATVTTAPIFLKIFKPQDQ